MLPDFQNKNSSETLKGLLNQWRYLKRKNQNFSFIKKIKKCDSSLFLHPFFQRFLQFYMLKNQFLKSEITLYPPYMSVERVGISKKSENHIQKKSTPFLWTSFQGVGKSPPGWDFPPTSLLLRGVGFQPGGREFPTPYTL